MRFKKKLVINILVVLTILCFTLDITTNSTDAASNGGVGGASLGGGGGSGETYKPVGVGYRLMLIDNSKAYENDNSYEKKKDKKVIAGNIGDEASDGLYQTAYFDTLYPNNVSGGKDVKDVAFKQRRTGMIVDLAGESLKGNRLAIAAASDDKKTGYSDIGASKKKVMMGDEIEVWQNVSQNAREHTVETPEKLIIKVTKATNDTAPKASGTWVKRKAVDAFLFSLSDNALINDGYNRKKNEGDKAYYKRVFKNLTVKNAFGDKATAQSRYINMNGHSFGLNNTLNDDFADDFTKATVGIRSEKSNSNNMKSSSNIAKALRADGKGGKDFTNDTAYTDYGRCVQLEVMQLFTNNVRYVNREAMTTNEAYYGKTGETTEAVGYQYRAYCEPVVLYEKSSKIVSYQTSARIRSRGYTSFRTAQIGPSLVGLTGHPKLTQDADPKDIYRWGTVIYKYKGAPQNGGIHLNNSDGGTTGDNPSCNSVRYVVGDQSSILSHTISNGAASKLKSGMNSDGKIPGGKGNNGLYKRNKSVTADAHELGPMASTLATSFGFAFYNKTTGDEGNPATEAYMERVTGTDWGLDEDGFFRWYNFMNYVNSSGGGHLNKGMYQALSQCGWTQGGHYIWGATTQDSTFTHDVHCATNVIIKIDASSSNPNAKGIVSTVSSGYAYEKGVKSDKKFANDLDGVTIDDLNTGFVYAYKSDLEAQPQTNPIISKLLKKFEYPDTTIVGKLKEENGLSKNNLTTEMYATSSKKCTLDGTLEANANGKYNTWKNTGGYQRFIGHNKGYFTQDYPMISWWVGTTKDNKGTEDKLNLYNTNKSEGTKIGDESSGVNKNIKDTIVNSTIDFNTVSLDSSSDMNAEDGNSDLPQGFDYMAGNVYQPTMKFKSDSDNNIYNLKKIADLDSVIGVIAQNAGYIDESKYITKHDSGVTTVAHGTDDRTNYMTMNIGHTATSLLAKANNLSRIQAIITRAGSTEDGYSIDVDNGRDDRDDPEDENDTGDDTTEVSINLPDDISDESDLTHHLKAIKIGRKNKDEGANRRQGLSMEVLVKQPKVRSYYTSASLVYLKDLEKPPVFKDAHTYYSGAARSNIEGDNPSIFGKTTNSNEFEKSQFCYYHTGEYNVSDTESMPMYVKNKVEEQSVLAYIAIVDNAGSEKARGGGKHYDSPGKENEVWNQDAWRVNFRDEFTGDMPTQEDFVRYLRASLSTGDYKPNIVKTGTIYTDTDSIVASNRYGTENRFDGYTIYVLKVIVPKTVRIVSTLNLHDFQLNHWYNQTYFTENKFGDEDNYTKVANDSGVEEYISNNRAYLYANADLVYNIANSKQWNDNHAVRKAVTNEYDAAFYNPPVGTGTGEPEILTFFGGTTAERRKFNQVRTYNLHEVLPSNGKSLVYNTTLAEGQASEDKSSGNIPSDSKDTLDIAKGSGDDVRYVSTSRDTASEAILSSQSNYTTSWNGAVGNDGGVPFKLANNTAFMTSLSMFPGSPLQPYSYYAGGDGAFETASCKGVTNEAELQEDAATSSSAHSFNAFNLSRNKFGDYRTISAISYSEDDTCEDGNKAVNYAIKTLGNYYSLGTLLKNNGSLTEGDDEIGIPATGVIDPASNYVDKASVALGQSTVTGGGVNDAGGDVTTNVNKSEPDSDIRHSMAYINYSVQDTIYYGSRWGVETGANYQYPSNDGSVRSENGYQYQEEYRTNPFMQSQKTATTVDGIGRIVKYADYVRNEGTIRSWQINIGQFTKDPKANNTGTIVPYNKTAFPIYNVENMLFEKVYKYRTSTNRVGANNRHYTDIKSKDDTSNPHVGLYNMTKDNDELYVAHENNTTLNVNGKTTNRGHSLVGDNSYKISYGDENVKVSTENDITNVTGADKSIVYKIAVVNPYSAVQYTETDGKYVVATQDGYVKYRPEVAMQVAVPEFADGGGTAGNVLSGYKAYEVLTMSERLRKTKLSAIYIAKLTKGDNKVTGVVYSDTIGADDNAFSDNEFAGSGGKDTNPVIYGGSDVSLKINGGALKLQAVGYALDMISIADSNRINSARGNGGRKYSDVIKGYNGYDKQTENSDNAGNVYNTWGNIGKDGDVPSGNTTYRVSRENFKKWAKELYGNIGIDVTLKTKAGNSSSGNTIKAFNNFNTSMKKLTCDMDDSKSIAFNINIKGGRILTGLSELGNGDGYLMQISGKEEKSAYQVGIDGFDALIKDLAKEYEVSNQEAWAIFRDSDMFDSILRSIESNDGLYLRHQESYEADDIAKEKNWLSNRTIDGTGMYNGTSGITMLNNGKTVLRNESYSRSGSYYNGGGTATQLVNGIIGNTFMAKANGYYNIAGRMGNWENDSSWGYTYASAISKYGYKAEEDANATFRNKHWYDEQVKTFVVRKYIAKEQGLDNITLVDKLDYDLTKESANNGNSGIGNHNTYTGNVNESYSGDSYEGRWYLTVMLNKKQTYIASLNTYKPKTGVISGDTKGDNNRKYNDAVCGGNVLVDNVYINGADFTIPDETTDEIVR